MTSRWAWSPLCAFDAARCMEMRLHARSGRGLREGLRHCGNSSDLGRHPWQAPMHPLRQTEAPGDGLKA